MSLLGERVQSRIRALGLSQSALAREVGMKPQGIQSICAGEVQRPRKLREIARALKTTEEYLLGESDDPSLPGQIGGMISSQGHSVESRVFPVIDLVRAGKYSEISDVYPEGDGAHGVTVYKAGDVGPRAFAVEVEGESMVVNPPKAGEVSYNPGDFIVCDPDATYKPGDLVIAKRDTDEQATFKKYRPVGLDGDGNEIIDLVPLNEDWPRIRIDADNPGHIVGKVVRHLRAM